VDFQIATAGSHRYVDEIRGVLQTELDVTELVGLCGEQDADRLLLRASNLPIEFFDLKSGLAGMILQKLMNYHLTVAIVVPAERITGRFKDLALEASRNQHFRVFTELEKARDWLIGK